MPSGKRERTTPLMMGRVLGEQDSLGGTPERFSSEGEKHERRGWDDVLPLEDELEPTRRYGSVDKVPRRRSAVLALVVLCICVGLGAAVGGFALFAKGNFPSWFKVTSHEPAAMSPPKQTPAEAPRTEPQLIAQPPVQPLPQPVAQPRAPTQAPAKVPVAAPKLPNALVPPDLEGAERLRQDAIAVRKRRQQRHSEDDYVWSQELKALVPAASLAQPPAQPNAAPAR
jgi:hypothetical protein